MMLESLPNEVVVVRRKNSWEDEGEVKGVWKIAYADFMTALMAFFLVMWLINVTDDSVRRGVAQYFNPVKLASTAPNRKGLNDPLINGDTNENGTKPFFGSKGGTDDPNALKKKLGDGEEIGQEVKDNPVTDTTRPNGKTGTFTQVHSEAELFSDPYAVLDTLSEKVQGAASTGGIPIDVGTGPERGNGARGGEAYRDPFDPLYWQSRPGSRIAGQGKDSSGSKTSDEMEKKLSDASALNPDEKKKTVEMSMREESAEATNRVLGQAYLFGVPSQTVDGTKQLEHAGSQTPRFGKVNKNSLLNHLSGKPGQAKADAEQPDNARRSEISRYSGPTEKPLINQHAATELTEVLKTVHGTPLEQTAKRVTVERTSKGTLISLTDGENFGMFAIGSAEPRPELVKLLERLGKVISQTPGQIVIKGHTDARPFKSRTYDNWRLSTARAHMALYMLSRSGVPKARFDRVEGYADRHLKVPGEPLAASNRRIEIYVQEHGE